VTKAILGAFRDIAGIDRQPGPGPTPVPATAALSTDSAAIPVLGESVFKDVLVRERKRADRFEAPFAVVLVDRSDDASGGGPWLPILESIAAVKRDADAVGWLDEGVVLALLLPEVPGEGALRVLDRLRHEISNRLGDGALAVLSMRVYAHGVAPKPDGFTFPPAELLIEAFAPEPAKPSRDALKRALDVVGGLGLLALFSPFMLAAAAAVKLTSPGPVFHRQIRIGRRGEPFTMLKFRTMHANAGHGIHQDYVTWFIKSSGKQPRNGDEIFKLTNDPRVTRAGRYLRKASIDELPQFWNVLRGDMSLVGPRPPLPFEVEQYQPWHRRRVLEAKPGVTGPWQVTGRSRTTFDDMVRLDLRYARSHTLWTDIKILAATPRAMFKGSA